MSVLAISPKSPFDFHKKVQFLNEFIQKQELITLIEINKRIYNILQDYKKDFKLDSTLFITKEEKELFKAIKEISKKLEKEKDYEKNMKALLEIKDTVYEFFDNVMINDKDLRIRENRMALIKELRSLFLYIGDISYLSQFK